MNTSKTQTIIIPNAPAIPGLSFRHYRGEADWPQMLVLSNLVNKADKTEEMETLAQLSHNYTHLKNCDPYKDAIVGEVNGEMIAFCRVWWAKEADGPYVCRMFGNIHPDWRRKGLGTALLAYNENRLREIAKENEHPQNAPHFFEGWSGDTMPGATALLESMEYEPERYFFEMTRSIDVPIPEAPLPAGLEIRPVKEEHMRPIWEADDEAFRDHWGYTAKTEEDYQRFLTNPDNKQHLWKVVWDGDQVAGMVLNGFFTEENKEFNRKRGWTDPICVRRPWRRRGLARALIAQSIHMFREMGYDDTALGVDTKNPNGALNLYQGMGYENKKTWISYRKSME